MAPVAGYGGQLHIAGHVTARTFAGRPAYSNGSPSNAG